MQKIGIVGAGAWGTALAAAARNAGRDVLIQAHETEVADAINQTHENTPFLPGVALDPGITATTELAELAAFADAVLLVAPAQFLRPVCAEIAPHWKKGVPAVICAKGIEQDSGSLMSEVVTETLGEDVPLAVLSGPSFAKEVALGLPTAITLAAQTAEMEHTLMTALASHNFRPYGSRDLIGAQMGGAVKNVLAIACGIVEGKGMGDNARAALITRGLSEIAVLSKAKGGQPETLMGLSGLGDLVLTCNAMQSRNFSLGVELGKGRVLADILAERKAVTEGVFTASSVTDLGRRHNVELPICTAMDGILNHHADIDATFSGLLSRPLREERFGA
ncbi:MAG: NAD(P)-dependent glycerol-3-phosphate dehydrogenase [Rhodospirillales bacterium]|nr:NAD(P)-dependent glycerol-3-phosphate dehydrogenase [Rhodospirillales bacterium]MCW8952086.1 NAD(P)-dependent glycerol-3-phosphate dehydrogenase [Rhodospirillales bacterium]MCW9039117.1 NAD(P)-dependent glycerol-3-phosphate dehydrogenase [Rhodospirillales bacterium]